MKIKFNSHDYLPLNKILKLRNLTIIVRSIFEEDCKYHPQVFLDESLYELIYFFNSIIKVHKLKKFDAGLL